MQLAGTVRGGGGAGSHHGTVGWGWRAGPPTRSERASFRHPSRAGAAGREPQTRAEPGAQHTTRASRGSKNQKGQSTDEPGNQRAWGLASTLPCFVLSSPSPPWMEGTVTAICLEVA